MAADGPSVGKDTDLGVSVARARPRALAVLRRFVCRALPQHREGRLRAHPSATGRRAVPPRAGRVVESRSLCEPCPSARLAPLAIAPAPDRAARHGAMGPLRGFEHREASGRSAAKGAARLATAGSNRSRPSPAQPTTAGAVSSPSSRPEPRTACARLSTPSSGRPRQRLAAIKSPPPSGASSIGSAVHGSSTSALPIADGAYRGPTAHGPRPTFRRADRWRSGLPALPASSRFRAPALTARSACRHEGLRAGTGAPLGAG
jgi:hypothetical protein